METFVAKDTYSIHFQLMAGHTVSQEAYLINLVIVGCSLILQEPAWSISDSPLRCIHPALLHCFFMLRECTNITSLLSWTHRNSLAEGIGVPSQDSLFLLTTDIKKI
jgi:hypothetical protein